jgi:hypothetical protein
MRWLDADPWMVPVPVTPSRYVALDPAHQPWNVQTAPGRVASFSWDLDALGEDEILLADLQLHPDDNAPGRLGAGRAGRYRGRVLKGVGRTSLAANWNRRDDRFHGNGWLSASSALRERFITEALRRDGAAHRVTPCEGLLLRALDAPERDSLAAAARASDWRLAPLDRVAVALTLRPADHARFSNVLYGLHHHEASPAYFGDLLLRFMAYTRDGGGGDGGAPEDAGAPDEIARAVVDAAERSVARAIEWVRRGVWWLSFHDNFTLDGRFVDLETPVYRGAPWVGFVRSAESGALHLAGFEAMNVAWQWRLFARAFASRLRAVADDGLLPSAGARRFLREVAAATRGRVVGCAALDPEALTARLVRELAAMLGATRRERATLTALGRAMAAGVFARRPVRFEEHVGAMLDGAQPAQPTVTGRAEFLAAKGLGAPALTERARWFRDAVESVEAMDDRDRALDAARRLLADGG